MKRRIVWIRHGESEWNAQGKWQGHTDVPLSETGRAQARALAARLHNRTFDQVYSSDLQRAHETATLALPQAEIQLDSRLREVSFGVFEGKSKDMMSEQERRELSQWWNAPYSLKVRGGESMECLNTRVAAWMETLPEEGEIAVFAHGGVIRNSVWQVVGKPNKGEWSVAIHNTSLTVIDYGPQRKLVQSINDAAHLEQFSKPSTDSVLQR